MRKLSDSYWNKFLTKRYDNRFIRDGVHFEDLIEELLRLSYPTEWIRTKRSNDFNRDFHITTHDRRIWAECKNYEDDISLDTIAPTLVMAQIFAVNTIIFFSYSSVNSSARRKIYAYGSRSDKQVYIVDEGRLDELIIKHKNYLPASLRPDEIDIIYPREANNKCNVNFYFVPSPIIGATLEDRLVMPIQQVKSINYNGIFEILVFCEATRLDCNYRIQITTDKSDHEVNEKYELIDPNHIELSELNINLDFKSSSGCVERILLRSRVFEPKMMFPQIVATVFDGNTQIVSEKTPQIQVKSIWAQQVPLIGEKYRQVICELKYNALQKGSLGCMLIFGKSGVGKTRLLKETLSVLLRYRYKIISFMGNESDSAQTVIKEIIYFAYEVPREEIFQHLEKHMSDDLLEIPEEATSVQAYRLAREVSNYMTDKELLNLIDKNFNIIYEKLSSEPIAIVIDNLQYFSEPLVYFIQKYILYSKHQTRVNRSVLLLSVNTDYINSYTEKLKALLGEIAKDRPEFLYKQIDGFADIDQAVMFIRQLLNIKDEHSNTQLKVLAEKTSLVPYYIYQTVYSLIDRHIVEYSQNNHAYIVDMARFYKAIEHLPDDIHDIIHHRWQFALSQGNLEEKTSKTIFSLLSFIGFLDRERMESFCIPKSEIDRLIDLSFLAQDEEDRYIFDHDLVETYFVQHYAFDYFEIFNHVAHYHLMDEVDAYPFFRHYYNLMNEEITDNSLRAEVNCFAEHQIPPKLMRGFFRLLFRQIWKNADSFSTYSEWLIYISKLCNAYRNVVGFEEALEYYTRINDKIEMIGYSSFFSFPIFRNYINTYTDILLHLRKSESAIAFLESILQKMPDHNDNDSVLALNAMIYNRLMINHREFSSAEHAYQRALCLEKSYSLAERIQNPNLKDEFMYLNLSDEGYVFYALKKDKDRLLNVWNKCKDYTPERLPQKALNYYRKMVQLFLIDGEPQRALQFIDKIDQYIKNHAYTSEKLVFQIFCRTAETMCLIMENPTEHYNELQNKINDLMLMSKLKGGNKEYDILNLKAIVAFYYGDMQGMLVALKEAYKIIMSVPNTMNLEEKRNMIAHNIVYACIKSKNIEKIKELLFDKSKEEISGLIETCKKPNYIAEGIISTGDQKFNLPVVA